MMTTRKVKKIQIVMVIIMATFFCFSLGGYILFRPAMPPVYCHGSLQEYLGDRRLIASVNVALKNGKGSIVLMGKVIHPDGNENSFYIKKYAAYQLRGNVLLLSKTEHPLFTSSGTDVRMLKGYLQDFFIENSPPRFTIRMYRLAEREDTWVVSSTGKDPYLLCIDH